MDKAYIANQVIGDRVYVDITPGKTFRGLVQGIPRMGKSVLLKRLMLELSKQPTRQIVCFDPKYGDYSDMTRRIHLFSDQLEFNDILNSLVGEMNRRLARLRNLSKGALTPEDGIYQIDVVIDEAEKFFKPSDETIPKSVKDRRMAMVTELADMGGAAGISVIISAHSASSKTMDTDLRAQLIDLRFGFRTGSVEMTKYIAGESYEQAPMHDLPYDGQGVMYAATNDPSTRGYFRKCRVRPIEEGEVGYIMDQTARFKRDLTFLDSSSPDYAF